MSLNLNIPPDLIIYHIDGQYAIRNPNDWQEGEEEVYIITRDQPRRIDDDDVEYKMKVLDELKYSLGFEGDRYDARRIYIGSRPGDKHHDYHLLRCSECDCGCAPDKSEHSQEAEPFDPSNSY